jgi:hypothetical protein
MKLLPLPIRDFTPPMEGDGPLKRMLDRKIETWFDETFGLERCRDPARMPQETLDEMGHLLAADIADGDSERVKRVKIALAIDHLKSRGTWAKIKELIDALTGTDSRVYDNNTTQAEDQWVLMGGETMSSTVDSELFSIIGGKDASEPYGIKMSGGTTQDGDKGTLIGGPGIIYIDLIDGTLSASVQEAVKKELILQVPAYFRVFIGYYDTSAREYKIFPNGEV